MIAIKKEAKDAGVPGSGSDLTGEEISVDGLQFSYGGKEGSTVLSNVSFRIDMPGLYSILGPNGVGKSTLIHCINRILDPTMGSVTIDGSDVSGISLKELAKVVGYVPYSANDSFPLTVTDTVMLGRHPHSRWNSLEEDLDIVYDSLRMVGMEDFAMRPFNELSAGQHQKVMLARGFAQRTRILLLDEPTSNLDVRHQLEVTKLLRDMAHEKGLIVLMISHDLNIAAKYSDWVLMLHGGRIYASGTPEEVINEENIRTVYDVDSKVIHVNGKPHVILLDGTDSTVSIEV